MRILSVVTLVTPTSDYGGPVRVAINQADALMALGHDVTVMAAERGYDDPPTSIGGVPVVTFPARTLVPGTGFAGLEAAGARSWLKSNARTFDVAHVHVARDLVTLPAADRLRRHGVPYVLQPHGMIDPSSNPLAGPLDLLLTRPVLRDAAAIFHLTDVERQGILAVGGHAAQLVELGNGVPEYSRDAEPKDTLEVLYLARLASRKRPLEFVAMAEELATKHPRATFRIVGPDEGLGSEVRAAIEGTGLGHRLSWEGPVSPEESVARMARASVYVLPAVDEPYPMSVLEAMSLGVPVVITDSCGLAPFVERTGSGAVVDTSTEHLVQAVDRLLGDDDARAGAGARAAAAVRAERSMGAVARQLEGIYRRIG